MIVLKLIFIITLQLLLAGVFLGVNVLSLTIHSLTVCGQFFVRNWYRSFRVS